MPFSIIIIYYLMSDLDPYWAYADYSLYIYGEKTLFCRLVLKTVLVRFSNTLIIYFTNSLIYLLLRILIIS